MHFYVICLMLLPCSFMFSSLPYLSHELRVKKLVEREFGGPDAYQEYQRGLVLRFFKERIAFEESVEKRREPKRILVLGSLEHVYSLAQPKAMMEEPIVLPCIISKKITEQEKSALFARLAQPKNIITRYQEPVDTKKKSIKKR